MIVSIYGVLFLLIALHFVADYPLQGNEVAIGKNKFKDPKHLGVPWYYWMLGHAFTHGVAVFLVTQVTLFLILETLSHFIIDYTKCKYPEYWTIHEDQAAHIVCKVAWWGFFVVFFH